jgi:hypothetical protein
MVFFDPKIPVRAGVLNLQKYPEFLTTYFLKAFAYFNGMNMKKRATS